MNHTYACCTSTIGPPCLHNRPHREVVLIGRLGPIFSPDSRPSYAEITTGEFVSTCANMAYNDRGESLRIAIEQLGGDY